ncbi:MAG: helix-turn-helix domain-containing protein [Ramlibacter sp.]|nr:helix-turn-helix domain-containing protein [Ramlibacter sp.]
MHSDLSLRHYDRAHGSHSHEHFQILLGLEGVLELEVAGCGRRIGAGDAWLVPPGERHDFESAHGAHCLVLDTAHPAWAHCASMPAQPQQTRALAGYLATALRHGQPLAARYGPGLLLESWAAAGEPPRVRRRIDWAGLAEWAAAHMDQPLTAADLAQRALLSPSQFAQRCQEAQGLSPMQWLRGLRLDQAQQLRRSGLGVADVAQRTGYRSPSALTAALRRRDRA